jgi:hypothetical protein
MSWRRELTDVVNKWNYRGHNESLTFDDTIVVVRDLIAGNIEEIKTNLNLCGITATKMEEIEYKIDTAQNNVRNRIHTQETEVIRRRCGGNEGCVICLNGVRDILNMLRS